MIKYSECDLRQKKAYKNIKNAAADYIFGLQNGCFDHDKNSQEYRDYFNELNNLPKLIEKVYAEAISAVYDGDSIMFGRAAEAYIRDVRFCGKDFLMKVVTQFCEKYQKEALSDLN